MRKTLICSLIGLVGCTWMAGCQDKPDGAQTIIIELADPSDQVEETKEELTEEEKQEARRKAVAQYQQMELQKLQNRNKPTAKKETQVQPSLFDF